MEKLRENDCNSRAVSKLNSPHGDGLGQEDPLPSEGEARSSPETCRGPGGHRGHRGPRGLIRGLEPGPHREACPCRTLRTASLFMSQALGSAAGNVTSRSKIRARAGDLRGWLCARAPGSPGRTPPRSVVSGSSPSDTVTRERSCIHCLLNTVSNNA